MDQSNLGVFNGFKDIIFIILSYLNLSDVLNMRRLNKTFNILVTDAPNYFWEDIIKSLLQLINDVFLENYNFQLYTLEGHFLKGPEYSFKRLYKICCAKLIFLNRYEEKKISMLGVYKYYNTITIQHVLGPLFEPIIKFIAEHKGNSYFMKLFKCTLIVGKIEPNGQPNFRIDFNLDNLLLCRITKSKKIYIETCPRTIYNTKVSSYITALHVLKLNIDNPDINENIYHIRLYLEGLRNIIQNY